jgi:hypothetical protein
MEMPKMARKHNAIVFATDAKASSPSLSSNIVNDRARNPIRRVAFSTHGTVKQHDQPGLS